MKKAIVGAAIVGVFAFAGVAYGASAVVAPWFTVATTTAPLSKAYSLERVADSDGTVCYAVVAYTGAVGAVSCVK